MRIAAETILQLSIELQRNGIHWSHPWDHYPFITTGKRIWLRYSELDARQAGQVRAVVADVVSRLGPPPPASLARKS
jgi:hypothetical protein